MSARTITIERYMLPGSQDVETVTILLTLVDSTGKAIDGYRTNDSTGIIGTQEFTLTDEPLTIQLIPTSEIYPTSYWNIKIKYNERVVRNSTVQMTSGTELTFPEFLALDTTVDYWDVYEDRLLPDPSLYDVGNTLSIQLVGGIKQWVVS